MGSQEISAIYRGLKLSWFEIIGFREYFPARLPFYLKNPPRPRNRQRAKIRDMKNELERTLIMRAMYRLPLALIMTASGLGLVLYGTYGDRTLGSYFAILSTVIFMGGLLLALWQFRPGTASPSRR
jgi:hypothetical protein